MVRSAINEREHRRGLVLGLTLAEVLLLLLFLLLLALAARLHQLEQTAAAFEKVKPIITDGIDKEGARDLVARINSVTTLEKRVRDLEAANSKLRPLTRALKDDASKIERMGAIIEWAARIEPDDPPAPLRRAVALLEALGPTTRSEDVSELAAMRRELEKKLREAGEAGKGKHNWPPIISLSEADGYFFETGSAELSPQFRATLGGAVMARLLDTVKEYDVNIIEVIGHTDEQRIVERPSNLDKTLIPFLQQQPLTERFTPADNAGLGLARAVAVVRVLSSDQRLAGLRILPFSGGQLVDVGDKRADGASSGNVKERRRIEIRVRRSDRDKPVEKTTWSADTQAALVEQPIAGQALVIDGDTIDIAGTRIRLWGIDAIESAQTCKKDGRVWDCATDILFGLSAHLEGQTVTCQSKGHDQYGRVVATCIARGSDLGAWLVSQGLALDYSRYSGGAYKVQEAMAKAAKRGIWRGEFVPPWEWRGQNKTH
jgi:endonuclease YncB( thermonuclease family)/flagellar motor protein MotB